jgi:hypothetical protein
MRSAVLGTIEKIEDRKMLDNDTVIQEVILGVRDQDAFYNMRVIFYEEKTLMVKNLTEGEEVIVMFDLKTRLKGHLEAQYSIYNNLIGVWIGNPHYYEGGYDIWNKPQPINYESKSELEL